MAPEIIGEKKYDHRTDIWSIGIITYILMSGRPPFRGRAKEEILKSIQTRPVSFETEVWKKTSEEAKDFIKQCLHQDYLHRPDCDKLLEHPWIVNRINKKTMSKDTQLGITNNLREFKATTTFQNGVL